MDTVREDHQELWAAKRKEMDSKAERLSAEQKLKYNDAFDNFGKEVEAAGEWSEAAWHEFNAKVDRKWQEFAIDMKE